ncbi:MAG: flagellar hook-basal body complex protein, partial [Oscillospiraceae bacterium]|nr:flagellar hook-basal body complex protein [Oscillospiraceae bacterium]
MVRSLYSGVAGLKTQQTKMDVIGNNIANVGTYGFKSDRATFKDVYYQTTATATAATGNIGGTNAKQIGYGNSVGSIDTNTKTSAMSSTGYGLDVAIAGEGFLQVMGLDGKIMYTKAGMLDVDADGNLVDVNGNFVLGISGSDTTLPPASNKIKIDLPFLDPQPASVESTINNVEYTITSANSTDKANVNITFVSSASLPIGQKMTAKVSGASIVVTVNANEEFSDIDEINVEMNKAIKSANGGVEHPAGEFIIDMVPSDSKFSTVDIDGVTTQPIKLKGSELVGTNFGYIAGEVTMPGDLKGLFGVESVSEGFTGDTRSSKFPPIAFSASNQNPSINAAQDTVTVTFDSSWGNGNTVSYAIADLTGLTSPIATATLQPNGDILVKDGSGGEFTINEASLQAKANLSAPPNNKSQDFVVSYDSATGLEITMTDANGKTYVGNVSPEQLKSAGSVVMYAQGGTSDDSFVISYPSITTLKSTLPDIATKNSGSVSLIDNATANNPLTSLTNADEFVFTFSDAVNMNQSEPSRNLGLGQSSFKLSGGTEGGEQ